MVLINPGANALPNQRRRVARWNGCYILCGMDRQDQPAPPHLILIRIGRLPSWGAVSNSSSPAEKRLDPPRGQFILLSSVTTACVCGASEGPSGGGGKHSPFMRKDTDRLRADASPLLAKERQKRKPDWQPWSAPTSVWTAPEERLPDCYYLWAVGCLPWWSLYFLGVPAFPGESCLLWAALIFLGEPALPCGPAPTFP